MHPLIQNTAAGLASRALLLLIFGVFLLAIVLLGGFWVCWAIYMALLPAMGAAGAAGVIGGVLIFLVIFGTWLGYRKLAYLKVKRPLAPSPGTLAGQPLSSAGYQAGLTAASMLSARMGGSPLKTMLILAAGGALLGFTKGRPRKPR